MDGDVYDQVSKFYHKKTFDKKWKLECGNGNKKLDEIQVFIQYLKNKNEKIFDVGFFDQNFKYKENDVKEPGDLEYAGQIYQITHGNLRNYSDLQKKKDFQIKLQVVGQSPEVFMVAARDIALTGSEKYKFYCQDLSKKEKSATSNIVLLVRIDRREVEVSDYKVGTKWQDVVFVFENGNISIKK